MPIELYKHTGRLETPHPTLLSWGPPTLHWCIPSPWGTGCEISWAAASDAPLWAMADRFSQHQCRSLSLSHEYHGSLTPRTRWCPSVVSTDAVCSWGALAHDGYPPSSHSQRSWWNCTGQEWYYGSSHTCRYTQTIITIEWYMCACMIFMQQMIFPNDGPTCSS